MVRQMKYKLAALALIAGVLPTGAAPPGRSRQHHGFGDGNDRYASMRVIGGDKQ